MVCRLESSMLSFVVTYRWTFAAASKSTVGCYIVSILFCLRPFFDNRMDIQCTIQWMQTLFSLQQQSHGLEYCLKSLVEWTGFAWQELWKLSIVSLFSWIPRVYMPAWWYFEASSWLSEANVMTKVPIAPISMVFYLFYFASKISWHVQERLLFTLISLGPRRSISHFLHRLERKTRTEILLS